MNYQSYGKYKGVRNAAWHCLIDHQVQSLPVSVLKIADQSGIKVVENSEVYMLSPTERGRSLCKDDKWYIVFDDEDILPKQRFTIAHELGHIFLGHEIKRYMQDDRAEMEANMFALRLLAPACVLWALEKQVFEQFSNFICENKKK